MEGGEWYIGECAQHTRGNGIITSISSGSCLSNILQGQCIFWLSVDLSHCTHSFCGSQENSISACLLLTPLLLQELLWIIYPSNSHSNAYIRSINFCGKQPGTLKRDLISSGSEFLVESFNNILSC